MRQFAHPWAFALLLLIALRLFWSIREWRGGGGAFDFPSLGLVLPRRRSLKASLFWLPTLIEAAALVCLVVALARPQAVTTTSSERYGIDIVVAVDASGSMAAQDFHPRNRFAVAKELVAGFVEQRQNDRIGIVTFGARAATRVPITFDRQVAADALKKAEIGDNGDGTAIGHALATSVNRLKGSKSRSRVIILLTDGVNNAGSIDPLTASALAATAGIKIYAIGIGSQGTTFAPVRVQDPITGEIREERVPIRADIDEPMMQKIAASTGGAYFRAVDRDALAGVLGRIDQLEKSRQAAPKRITIEELYVEPLLWGIALCALSILTGETLWMRLPA